MCFILSYEPYLQSQIYKLEDMDPVLLLCSAQQDAVPIVVVQMMKMMACQCNHFGEHLFGTQV